MNDPLNINIIDLDNILHVGTKSSKLGALNVHGIPTGGIYNFMKLLRDNFLLSHPNYNKAVVVYDLGKPIRKEWYEEYKANRSRYKNEKDLTLDKAVRFQKELIIKMCQAVGIPILGIAGMEADDLQFNIILNLVYNEATFSNPESNVIIHTSDADWLGVLNFTDRIRIKPSNSLSSKLNGITTIHDYYPVIGTNPLKHYLEKSIFGDAGDNYFGNSMFGIYQNEDFESNLNINTFWNYFHWETYFKNLGVGTAENLLQMKLAFPIFHQELFEMNWLEYISNSNINFDELKNFLSLTRINLFKKLLGELPPFTQKDVEDIERLKQSFMGDYTEVFEYFEKIKYVPKISLEEAVKAFE